MLLGERSRRISEVLNLIKEIAGEIHLLAVNAAIESAAAGEHGKRFAVVAGEVRRLAERTRDSAEEIKAIVGEIQSATHSSVLATEQGVKEVENGVALATGARGSLEQIMQMVDRTTQAIRQITLATQQQQSASEQIVQTMREVAVVTSQAAAGMKQSATSVAELNCSPISSRRASRNSSCSAADDERRDRIARRPLRRQRPPGACRISGSSWAPSCTRCR